MMRNRMIGIASEGPFDFKAFRRAKFVSDGDERMGGGVVQIGFDARIEKLKQRLVGLGREKKDLETGKGSEYEMLEGGVKIISWLPLNGSEKVSLLTELTELLIEDGRRKSGNDFGYWVHSVSHLWGIYAELGRELGEAIELGNRLSEEVMTGALRTGNYNCVERVTGTKFEGAARKVLGRNAEIARSATERVEGIFYDVDGTLLQFGKLRSEYVEKMRKDMLSGKTVIIATGGDPEAQKAKLLEAGFSPAVMKFVRVISKDELKGKIVGEMVDDTQPEDQGIKAEKWVKPENSYGNPLG